MNNTLDFDVNLISKILFRPSYHLKEYVWRAEEIVPKYKRFLWIKWKSGFQTNPEGFYEERTDYYGNVYSRLVDEYWIKSNIIKEVPNGKEVWSKASVEISLGYKSSIGRKFDTNIEANEWIDKLKKLSNKTFETYEYKQ